MMKKTLLRNMTAAIAALFITMFALPGRAQSETQYYNLKIAGVWVTSDNCKDLTVIEGVTGKASYDPATKTLTLDDATIHATGEEVNGFGIFNKIDGLTIRPVGNSTVTSDKRVGIYNYEDCHLTLTGNGSLTVKGSTTAEDERHCQGIQNRGYLTVSGCTVEASGGYSGLTTGYWTFDNCTVRARGGGGSYDNIGSISYMWEKPTFKDCAITRPADATWHVFQDGGTFYSLYGADGKVVTDWVTIEPTAPTGITAPTADAPDTSAPVYNLEGMRINQKWDVLPKGVYIVKGKKVIKK